MSLLASRNQGRKFHFQLGYIFGLTVSTNCSSVVHIIKPRKICHNSKKSNLFGFLLRITYLISEHLSLFLVLYNTFYFMLLILLIFFRVKMWSSVQYGGVILGLLLLVQNTRGQCPQQCLCMSQIQVSFQKK